MRRADDRRVAAVARLPQPVAEHRRPAAPLGRSSAAVNTRPSSGAAPSTSKVFAVTGPTPTRTGSPSPVRFCCAVSQPATARQRCARAAVVEDLLSRQPGLVEADPAAPDHHAAIGLGVGQRREQHRADDAEDGRGGADAERERDQRGRGKSRTAPAARGCPTVTSCRIPFRLMAIASPPPCAAGSDGRRAVQGCTDARTALGARGQRLEFRRWLRPRPSCRCRRSSRRSCDALADPPDHEDGRAPEHRGDGAEPGRRHLVRRRLGEPRGAGGVPAGLSGDRQRRRARSTRAAPTPPPSATWPAASNSRASRRTSSACRGSAPSTSRSGSAAPSSPTTCSARCVDPGDTVMLLDPTYANYEGQLAFVAPGARIVRLPVAGPGVVDLPAGGRPRRRGPRLHARSSIATSRSWCSSARPTTRPARSCRRRSPS